LQVYATQDNRAVRDEGCAPDCHCPALPYLPGIGCFASMSSAVLSLQHSVPIVSMRATTANIGIN